MKNKFFLYFVAAIFFSGNTLPIISSINNDEPQKEVITPEYLENLPSNDYIIGPGDKLEIIISRDLPELSNEVLVDGEGTIFLSRINRVFVNGLTINELKKLLNQVYKKYVKYPSVEILVKSYRPIRVFVKGEVVNPGLQTMRGFYSVNRTSDDPFDFSNNKRPINSVNLSQQEELSYFFPTVFDAIRQSGGITQFSDLSNVEIIRKNNISDGGGKITTKLNFESVIYTGKLTQNIRIYDGDIIKVKKTNNSNFITLRKAILSNLNPRFIKVFVGGRVNSPGNITVSRASVLSDAIDMAGGPRVLKGPLTFIRFNNDGSIDKRKFSYKKRSKRGSYHNPNLRNGDLIIVGESLLSTTSEIVQEFTAPLLGIYSGYALIKLISE